MQSGAPSASCTRRPLRSMLGDTRRRPRGHATSKTMPAQHAAGEGPPRTRGTDGRSKTDSRSRSSRRARHPSDRARPGAHVPRGRMPGGPGLPRRFIGCLEDERSEVLELQRRIGGATPGLRRVRLRQDIRPHSREKPASGRARRRHSRPCVQEAHDVTRARKEGLRPRCYRAAVGHWDPQGDPGCGSPGVDGGTSSRIQCEKAVDNSAGPAARRSLRLHKNRAKTAVSWQFSH